MRRQDPNQLTDREREVLGLLRRDFTNEQIADRLGISLDGAKYHVSQILSKFGVATREEAAAWRPEPERAGYWKWAFFGGLGAIGAIAASALVLAIPRGGNDVQLESGVLARGSESKDMQSHSTAKSTPRPVSTGQALAPTTGPEITLATTAASEFYVDPEPTADSTPTSASEPTSTPEPVATPRPTECACSGIQGTVTESPVCPIGCTPVPYQATIAVWNADRTSTLLELTTDARGHFRVPLPEGQYYVDPEGPMSPPDLYFVVVPANGFVEVNIDYDTGIR